MAKTNSFLRDCYRELAQRVAKKLTKGRILDVGTGPEYLLIEVARLIKGVEVVGIDVSKDMVRIARKNARKERLESKVRFEVEDTNSMSYDDSSFDLASAQAAFTTGRDLSGC